MTERLAFVGMFMAMAGFVVGLSVIAAKTGPGDLAGRSVAASSRTVLPGSGDQGQPPCRVTKAAVPRSTRIPSAQPSGVLNARLTTALRAALGTRAAPLSVGVVDTETGAESLYRPGKLYQAGGIAGADILAALLYEHQPARTAITGQDADVAAKMIENGSRTAAAKLWQAIGRGAGLAAANRALGLRHIIPGRADAWALTSTTIADQLQLLTDLAGTESALAPSCRAYEVSLMARPAAARRWGVPAAAGAGTSYAVSDAWRPGAGRFVVNSIGIIDRGGHVFLVVILSRDWPTRAAGISAVRAAAVAAVGAMLRSP